MEYPLATGDDIHYQHPYGFVLEWISTDLFIKLTPDLQIEDIEENEYILNLAQHIKDGFPLDGLELGENLYHDGRHRAAAAKVCGINKVPVYMHENVRNFIFEFFV